MNSEILEEVDKALSKNQDVVVLVKLTPKVQRHIRLKEIEGKTSLEKLTNLFYIIEDQNYKDCIMFIGNKNPASYEINKNFKNRILKQST